MRARDKAGFRIFFAYAEETGLLGPLREICLAHSTTLFEIYTDAKGPASHAARLECWAHLIIEVGKSAGEVARFFDRDPASILYGMRKLREIGPLGPETARDLARGVAERTSGARKRGAAAARARIGQEGLSNGASVVPPSDPETIPGPSSKK